MFSPPDQTRHRTRRITGPNQPLEPPHGNQTSSQSEAPEKTGGRGGGGGGADLLAGGGRGEEVDAVGAPPQRLLLRRQRLRCARRRRRHLRGSVHLHGPPSRTGGVGGPRDPPLPTAARATRHRSVKRGGARPRRSLAAAAGVDLCPPPRGERS
jgi:hypothetical protein